MKNKNRIEKCFLVGVMLIILITIIWRQNKNQNNIKINAQTLSAPRYYSTPIRNNIPRQLIAKNCNEINITQCSKYLNCMTSDHNLNEYDESFGPSVCLPKLCKNVIEQFFTNPEKTCGITQEYITFTRCKWNNFEEKKCQNPADLMISISSYLSERYLEPPLPPQNQNTQCQQQCASYTNECPAEAQCTCTC